MIDMVDKTTMFTFIHTFQNEWKQRWGIIFPIKLAQAFKRDKTQCLCFITEFITCMSFSATISLFWRPLRGYHLEDQKLWVTVLYHLSCSLNPTIFQVLSILLPKCISSVPHSFVTVEHHSSHLTISPPSGLSNSYFPPLIFNLYNHQIYHPQYSSNRITMMLKNIQCLSITFQNQNTYLSLAFKAYHNMTPSQPSISPQRKWPTCNFTQTSSNLASKIFHPFHNLSENCLLKSP